MKAIRYEKITWQTLYSGSIINHRDSVILWKVSPVLIPSYRRCTKTIIKNESKGLPHGSKWVIFCFVNNSAVNEETKTMSAYFHGELGGATSGSGLFKYGAPMRGRQPQNH